ncbi:MAG TPA: hypothetical protein VJJ75_00475 [Candidatus Nanoarchaeia archaeon]|nr:hypothetical protein [Candidatus Nanoarchaeia archaeon]
MQKRWMVLILVVLLALPVIAYETYDSGFGGGSYDRPKEGSFDTWGREDVVEEPEQPREKKSLGEIFGIKDLKAWELYDDYKYFIDFFIFFLIFMGLARMVYSGSFQSGHGPLTLGIALALSLGVVMWEKTKLDGKSIFQAYGLIGVVFLAIVLLVVAFYILTRAVNRGAGFAVLLFMLFAFLFSLLVLIDPSYWFTDMAAREGWDQSNLQTIFKWVAIASAAGFVITGISMLFANRRRTGGGTP